MSDSSDQVYQYLANPGTPGKLIHRIPFHHPAQLYSIMMVSKPDLLFDSDLTLLFSTLDSNKHSTLSSQVSSTRKRTDLILPMQLK